MKFCDKVKKECRAKGLTQQQFADMLGVSLRTITNYEKGESYPKQREIYGKMAEILGVDINYLLTENEEFYISANEKYGATGAQQAKALMQEVTGLFAGGKLDQDDMDEMMKAIQDAREEQKICVKAERARMLSCFNEAVDKADELIALYGRCSPKRLARELDIEVLERDFSKQKGAYKLILKNPFIFIKRDLSDSMKKIVLMHEIGHDRLHRDKADDCGGFAEYDIFDMCDRSMEYEANLFAAQFLISDEELYDCINCGYDIDKTAAALCTDRNIIALKVDILKKQGAKLYSQLHDNKFLAGD